MNRVYPTALIEAFGNDLKDIFGSAEEQKKKKGLKTIAGNTAIIDPLLEKLPNGGVLDVYAEFGRNARPSFLDVAIRILKDIETSGIFEEYKLPPLGEKLNRIGGALVDWDKLYLRYPVQRAVNIKHILRDILIEWDDNLNDPAYVRVLSDGTMNVNDKQHGNFGRLIMGAEQVYVEGFHSDDAYMDSNAFGSRNIAALKTSWESNANNRIDRARAYQQDGLTVKLDDLPYLEFADLLDGFGAGWQEKGTDLQPKQCDNGDKLYKDFCQYKEHDVFKTAVSLNVDIWPHGELSREFVWGTCEFLDQMYASGFNDSQMRDIKSAIKKAVKETYPDKMNRVNRGTGPGTLWGSVKDFMKSLPNKGPDKDWRLNVSPNYLIAAGLRDLIVNMNAYYKAKKNQQTLKLDLPLIKDKDGAEFEMDVAFFAEGWNKTGKGEYHRIKKSTAKFNATKLNFQKVA